MDRMVLSKNQVYELVLANRYPVDKGARFQSRCIDGRYENRADLPALAIPGADAGELAIFLATANIFGFELDLKKSFRLLCEIVGGIKNFSFHTDAHAHLHLPAAGDGHLRQIRQDPQAYNLEKDQIDLLVTELRLAKKKGAKEIVLHGEHREGALIQIKGDYGVLPKFAFRTGVGQENMEVFVFHETLIAERHKALAKKLLTDGAVKLFPGCDEEYLYEAFCETTDAHLFETMQRLGKNLPIFSVEFDEEGLFRVEELGRA